MIMSTVQIEVGDKTPKRHSAKDFPGVRIIVGTPILPEKFEIEHEERWIRRAEVSKHSWELPNWFEATRQK